MLQNANLALIFEMKTFNHQLLNFRRKVASFCGGEKNCATLKPKPRTLSTGRRPSVTLRKWRLMMPQHSTRLLCCSHRYTTAALVYSRLGAISFANGAHYRWSTTLEVRFTLFRRGFSIFGVKHNFAQ